MRSCKGWEEMVMPPREATGAADLFLRHSFHRIRRFLNELTENDDKALLATANSVLGKDDPAGLNGR